MYAFCHWKSKENGVHFPSNCLQPVDLSFIVEKNCVQAFAEITVVVWSLLV